MVAGLSRALEPLSRRIGGLVRRGVVHTAANGGGRLTLQVEALAGDTRDGCEYMLPYGLFAHPLPGGEAVPVAVGATPGHSVVLTVADRRYHLREGRPGEVALHDDQGQVVHLTREGIRIETALAITIEAAQSVDVAGDTVTVTASTLARITAPEVQIHAAQSLRLDAGGYGETWTPTGRKTWTQGASTTQMGPPSPPEHTP